MDSQDGVGGDTAYFQGGGPLKRWTTFSIFLLAATFSIFHQLALSGHLLALFLSILFLWTATTSPWNHLSNYTQQVVKVNASATH